MGFARLSFSNATHRQNALDEYMYRILILIVFFVISFLLLPLTHHVRTLSSSSVRTTRTGRERRNGGERDAARQRGGRRRGGRVHRPLPGGAPSCSRRCPLRAVQCPLFLAIDLSLYVRVFCLCVPALGVGLRSHSSMPRQRSPATGFPFAARRSACRPASSASALCARPAPSRARREPR